MSRIGKRELIIPSNVQLDLKENLLVINANNNQIDIPFNKHLIQVFINQTTKTVSTKIKNSSKEAKMLVGTINALINNAFIGLTKGFSKILKMTGVGYKAAITNNQLVLTLGFSHPIILNIPKTIQVQLISPTEIKLTSYHKEQLGEFAANIRKWRKPEPYKGKGIAYENEFILRKVGKTSDGGKGKK